MRLRLRVGASKDDGLRAPLTLTLTLALTLALALTLFMCLRAPLALVEA